MIIGKYLLGMYFYILIYLTHTHENIWVKHYYYAHFTGKETKAERVK